MAKVFKMIMAVLFISSVIAGCGTSASENKPIDQVKSESKTMSADELQGVVNNYKKAIESKKTQLQKISVELQKIPLKEMMGKEAKALQGDISQVSTSVRALTERLNVYAKELSVKLKQ